MRYKQKREKQVTNDNTSTELFACLKQQGSESRNSEPKHNRHGAACQDSLRVCNNLVDRWDVCGRSGGCDNGSRCSHWGRNWSNVSWGNVTGWGLHRGSGGGGDSGGASFDCGWLGGSWSGSGGSRGRIVVDFGLSCCWWGGRSVVVCFWFGSSWGGGRNWCGFVFVVCGSWGWLGGSWGGSSWSSVVGVASSSWSGWGSGSRGSRLILSVGWDDIGGDKSSGNSDGSEDLHFKGLLDCCCLDNEEKELEMTRHFITKAKI
ncbi:hypothetical protein BJ741DRAFT_622382 [Chytriomyces cf. hyalinus JEL632]|nr:hypothetical protein BJ741DRAFT_622382 [Chytriomyces cf. hyalinus JEL632]